MPAASPPLPDLNAPALWHCHGCHGRHLLTEHAIAHAATARALIGAAVVETAVYVCDRWSRGTLLRAVAEEAATLTRELNERTGDA